MVRRVSDLTGRKDRRDFPSSHANFRGSGERRGLAGDSTSVLRHSPKHASAPTCRALVQWPAFLWGEQIPGTAPHKGILNFPYRNFALLWL